MPVPAIAPIEHETDGSAYYLRCLDYELAQTPEETFRFRNWAIESLAMGIREYVRSCIPGRDRWARQGDVKVALRCLLHARECIGRDGGHRSVAVADAAVWLQNRLEDAVARGEV